MKRPCALLIGLFVMSPALLTAQTPQTVQAGTAPIREVTVYLDGAEIVRAVDVDVPPGASTIEISEFAKGIGSASIRASIEGVPAIVRSVSIVGNDSDETHEPSALDRRVQELEDEHFRLQQEAADDETLRLYLKNVAEAAAGSRNDRASDDAGELPMAEILDLMDGQFDVLLTRRLERRKARRDLKTQLDKAKKEQAEAKAEEVQPTARLQVESERGGRARLALRYFVNQAAWRPSYRGTLTDDDRLDLMAEAAVSQSTGEPWDDIRLKLSTVRPSASLSPPHLAEWLIRPWIATPRVTSEAPMLDQRKMRIQNQAVTVTEADLEEIRRVQANLGISSTQTSYSVTYDVPGTVSIASEGDPRQVTTWRRSLSSKVAYRIKPSLQASAYLEATVRAPTEVPILAGSLNLYSSAGTGTETLIGSHQLPETGPGAVRIIPFGPDPRIKVERRTEDVTEGRQGVVRKQRREARAYRTKITNHRDEAVTLVIEERLPVADDERIEVSLSESTTPGHKPSETRRGVLIWTLDLAPGEVLEHRFGFEIEYPVDLRVQGLDEAG